MEIVGFASAILGVVAAILNRKRIIILRYETGGQSSSSPAFHAHAVTAGKRFKRCVLALLASFALPMIDVLTGEHLRDVLIWPFAGCLLVAGYQFLAMIILILVKLWR